jgi:hypothetical protein
MFFIKLKRAAAYFIQGWNSTDCHYTCLLSDMIFKIERMARLTLKLKQTENYYSDVKAMVKIIRLLRILACQDVRHANSLWDKHDAKWGQLRFVIADGKMEFYRNKLDPMSPKQVEKEQKEFKAIGKKIDYHRKKTKNKAFKLLKENYERWWI